MKEIEEKLKAKFDENEIEFLKNELIKEDRNIIIEECTSWKEGGKGAENIARKIAQEVENDEKNNEISYVYNMEDDIKEKITKLNDRIYKANKIIYTENSSMQENLQ